jgi:hypothetical protein
MKCPGGAKRSTAPPARLPWAGFAHRQAAISGANCSKTEKAARSGLFTMLQASTRHEFQSTASGDADVHSGEMDIKCLDGITQIMFYYPRGCRSHEILQKVPALNSLCVKTVKQQSLFFSILQTNVSVYRYFVL